MLICYEISELTKGASFAIVPDGYIKTVTKTWRSYEITRRRCLGRG